MNICRALSRARFGILTIALTYLLSVSLGSLMVHTGNPFALARRDRLVSRAQSSVILTELRKGHAFRSALLDFAANLGLGGFTSTLAGRWAISPLQRIVVGSAALFLWTVSTKVGSGNGMGRFTTCLSFFCNSFRIRLPEEPE